VAEAKAYASVSKADRIQSETAAGVMRLAFLDRSSPNAGQVAVAKMLAKPIVRAISAACFCV